jgi:hypothetical protein
VLCSLFVASVEEVRAVARRRRVVVPLGVIVVKISSLEIGRVTFSRAASVTATAAVTTTITARAEVRGEGGEKEEEEERRRRQRSRFLEAAAAADEEK